jgi:hypothetical protein
MFSVVGMSRYMASKPGCSSRFVVIDSITAHELNAIDLPYAYHRLTRDILLEHIKLFEDRVEEFLGVVVDDEDLPSRGRIHRADGIDEFWRGKGSARQRASGPRPS